jgi:hypothetical protein
VDGSTSQLADTRKNQRRYPQPATQKKDCGFPVLKLAVLFCLNSGAILNVIWGSLHNHDLRLFRQLWDQLKAGDILLAYNYRLTANTPGAVPVIEQDTASTHMFSNLIAGVTYKIEVSVLGAAGPGDWSSPASLTAD